MKNIDFSQYTAQFQNLNLRDPGTWPVLPKIATLIALFAAVMVLGWFAYWSGQMETLDAGRQEEEKLKGEYKAKLQQAINLEALKKQKEQVAQYVLALEKQLPSKAEMDALLSDINQSGLGRGLQFELFRPNSPVIREYYAEQPISVRVSGGYHDMASFTSDVASLPRIVTLNNLEIKTDEKSGKLTFDAIAKTFRYLDQEELAAQRKAEADKKKAGKK
ncbi:MAG TPA: type 4a pilus biogenesis protein PilO [Burkholderiaceae bacterium]|nr:type 4a pilus biogenesis protein PilO [Burkholderiaceae bacterium]